MPEPPLHSVHNAVQLLGLFSRKRRELGLTEIARSLALTKQSTLRLLTTLTEGGLIERVPGQTTYRLGLRLWRGLHWLAYACWPVAMAHGLGIGTDHNATWVFALTMACAVSVPGGMCGATRKIITSTPTTERVSQIVITLRRCLSSFRRTL